MYSAPAFATLKERTREEEADKNCRDVVTFSGWMDVVTTAFGPGEFQVSSFEFRVRAASVVPFN
jgi:hypothetical protein